MMPRFDLALARIDAPSRQRAIALLPRRYPEIELLEQRDEGEHSELWICRAPARSHIERWCDEASIDPAGISSEPDLDGKK